jgi:hypothetical protein
VQIPFKGDANSGEFAKLRKVTIFLVMSVCPPFCSAPSARICTKFDFGGFFENLSGRLVLHMKTQAHLGEYLAELFFL